MDFKEFLKGKKHIVFVFLAINSFALFVNVLGIEGQFKTLDKCDKTTEITNYTYTDDKYHRGSEDRYQRNFWPFVDFFYHSSYEEAEWCSNPYLGFFRWFDYSEFFVYLLIFIAVMYFYWNSVKDAPLPIKRSKIKNAFWEDVITNYVKKNVITNGLTIPYLVGVLKVKYSMKPTKETLSELISNLISSTSENKPVLQFCPEVNEYVVSLRSEVFCETNFKTEIFFRNVSNAKTLYITQNASQFGKTKEELVNSLWDRYGEQMEHNLFSWKPIKQQWFPFDENEIQRILWVEEM